MHHAIFSRHMSVVGQYQANVARAQFQAGEDVFCQSGIAPPIALRRINCLSIHHIDFQHLASGSDLLVGIECWGRKIGGSAERLP
jgi:hypothetical protein